MSSKSQEGFTESVIKMRNEFRTLFQITDLLIANFKLTEDVTDSPIDFEDLITCRSPVSSLRLDQSSEIDDNGEKEEEENEVMTVGIPPVKSPSLIKPDPDHQAELEIQSHHLDVSAIKTELTDER